MKTHEGRRVDVVMRTCLNILMMFCILGTGCYRDEGVGSIEEFEKGRGETLLQKHKSNGGPQYDCQHTLESICNFSCVLSETSQCNHVFFSRLFLLHICHHEKSLKPDSMMLYWYASPRKKKHENSEFMQGKGFT